MAADQNSSTGRVEAVTRALAILDAFRSGETSLALGELARRTRLHKTTVLRLARTLGVSRFLVQLDGGSWRLGPAAGWLGTRYHRGFDHAVTIEPVLRDLSHRTAESAAFYVREGNSRVCVVRVDGPEPVRYHARLGEVLPLEKGAPGRVLLAYSGEPGELYEGIRRLGHHVTSGERDPATASAACPVFGMNHSLVGCVAVTGPTGRFTRAATRRHVERVRKAATQLSVALGGNIAAVRASRR